MPFVVRLCVAFVPKLLLHEYDEPPVAVTLIAVVEHVNTVEPVLFVMPALGAVVFDVTVTLVVDEHPVVFEVTVTVYVPAAVILKAADVPTTDDPLDHEYVPPPVAVTLIAVLEQVNSVEPVLLVMPDVGGIVLLVMLMLAVALQLLALVTVTVYVPGVVMLKSAAEPTTDVPFDHE